MVVWADVPVRSKGRLAGIFYLLCIVLGLTADLLLAGTAGKAVELTADACYVVVTLLLYDILKPIRPNVSLLAAMFSMVGCAVTVLRMFHLVPFPINALVFFGVYCLLLGYLVFRSTFLPHFLSVLLAIAGLGWLTFVWPPLAHHVIRVVMVTGLLGEGGLTMWLLTKGIDTAAWRTQAEDRMVSNS